MRSKFRWRTQPLAYSEIGCRDAADPGVAAESEQFPSEPHYGCRRLLMRQMTLGSFALDALESHIAGTGIRVEEDHLGTAGD